MTTPTTPLQRDAVAPLAHIFLSLDLLESDLINEEARSYLTIIRQNIEKSQRLIQQPPTEVKSNI